ncbi:L,D-transpeptidase family protein [Streptomyces sp. DH12]|uniref:L,D-transpeptidase family protein n=1 Tax=Streptomyces sp. DH12 TaxID=2857010 RepID=UPI001E2E0F16|nr:L,D-transpeptidase family protein [Streptomyces sp. DH12]
MNGRSTAIRRALLAAAAVALAAGCTAQAAAPGGSAGGSPAPAASAAGAGSASPSSGAPGSSAAPSGQSSAAPSVSGSGGPSASASPAVLAKGTENEQVREAQARLRQLGHFHRSPTAFYGAMTAEAVSAFQGRRGLPATGDVDAATWAALVAATRQPTGDELRPPTTNEVDTPDQRCTTGRVLCISKESRTLAWMVDGKVVSAMDVRFGAVNTPTREGTFKVDRKERTWKSTLYHSDMPYSMFFSGGQAVHYSADFAARGYNGGSHGCVNVRDEARLAQVFAQVRVGDKVVVHW